MIKNTRIEYTPNAMWYYVFLPVRKFKWGDLDPPHAAVIALIHAALVSETQHYGHILVSLNFR